MITWRTTWLREAPIEKAALICSWLAPRTPARAASATGATQARKMSRIFEVSPIPNQMMIRGK